MGLLEFEYEGEAHFSNDEIKGLFSHLEQIVGVRPLPTSSPLIDGTDHLEPTKPGSKSEKPIPRLSIASIAARLNAKTGPDLAIAAAATLQIYQEQESFTRKQLLETMKSAKSYYKNVMSKNLTHTLTGLISSKRINSIGSDEMSLSATEMDSLREKLID